jgi:hypothetical protein
MVSKNNLEVNVIDALSTESPTALPWAPEMSWLTDQQREDGS